MCNPSCNYVIEEQLIQGSLGENQQTWSSGNNRKHKLDPLDDVAPNQTFHSIEVYYDYGPNVITFMGNNINQTFYERSIFTNVSELIDIRGSKIMR